MTNPNELVRTVLGRVFIMEYDARHATIKRKQSSFKGGAYIWIGKIDVKVPM